MPNSHTILIVEDEPHIADLLELNLKIEGFNIIITDLGLESLDILKSRRVDLMVLDVMLPDSNGIDICRKVKTIRNDLPILMLSALGQSNDRIKGLKSGADDYLPKPFNLEELLLKIHKLLKLYDRQKDELNKGIIQLGKANIDLEAMNITSADDSQQQYQLSIKETELLKYMLENKNKALSRQNILEHIWGFEHYPNTRTIDNYILNFRKSIELDPNNPQIIKTIRGIGYILIDRN